MDKKAFEDKAWSSMSVLLDKEMPQKEKKNRLIILFWGLLSISLILIWILFNYREQEMDIPIADSTSTVQSTDQKSEANNLKESVVSVVSKTSNADIKIGSSAVTNKTPNLNEIRMPKTKTDLTDNIQTLNDFNIFKQINSTVKSGKSRQLIKDEEDLLRDNNQELNKSELFEIRSQIAIRTLPVVSRFLDVDYPSYSIKQNGFDLNYNERNNYSSIGVFASSSQAKRIEGFGMNFSYYLKGNRRFDPYMGIGLEYYRFNNLTVKNSLVENFRSDFENNDPSSVEDFNANKIEFSQEASSDMHTLALFANLGLRITLNSRFYLENEFTAFYDLREKSNLTLASGEVSNIGAYPFFIEKNRKVRIKSSHHIGYNLSKVTSVYLGYQIQYLNDFNYVFDSSNKRSGLRYNRVNLGLKYTF